MRRIGVGAVILMALILTPFVVYFWGTVKNPSPSEPARSAFLSGGGGMPQENVDYITEVQDASSELHGEWLGVCSKNSIHSVADFKRTVDNDPVLIRHFEGFNWENARLGKQNETLLVHVSHRKGEVIKQTSKPIRLPKGDGYITDGVRTIRTYCCNDLDISPSAGIPEKPMAAADPPPSLLPEILPAELFAGEETKQYRDVLDPSSIVKGPYGRRSIQKSDPSPPPPSPPPSPPPVHPVPEPSALYLMGIGMVALAGLRLKRKR